MSYNYRDDITAINELVQNDHHAFKRSLLFVCATIQQQLETVPRIVREFEEVGPDSQYAFGFKSETINWINVNAFNLWSDAHKHADDPTGLLDVFLGVPGLGLAKAGFAAQLFANKVGCIDTHNIKVYDVPLQALRYPKRAQLATRNRYRDNYVALCRAVGGSASLWAKWCHYVHTLRPKNWSNGGDVSYFHYAVIAGEYDIDSDWLYFGLDYTPKFLIEHNVGI